MDNESKSLKRAARLAAYSASLAALAGGTAEAGNIRFEYTGVSAHNAPLAIDINQDGTTDFTIFHNVNVEPPVGSSPGDYSASARIEAVGSNGWRTSTFNGDPIRINSTGVLIRANQSFFTGSGRRDIASAFVTTDSTGTPATYVSGAGNWFDDSNPESAQVGFIGVRFVRTADNQMLNGWARIRVDGATVAGLTAGTDPGLRVTLLETGFNDIPGDGGADSFTGQGTLQPLFGEGVPEPSSLALLALGALGVNVLRRRSGDAPTA